MSWKDAALHVPLGLAFTGIAAGMMLLPWPLNVFVVGAGVIFFREVAQEQADAGNDIRTGWDFWNWGVGKTIETWVPIAVLLTIGIILTWLTK